MRPGHYLMLLLVCLATGCSTARPTNRIEAIRAQWAFEDQVEMTRVITMRPPF